MAYRFQEVNFLLQFLYLSLSIASEIFDVLDVGDPFKVDLLYHNFLLELVLGFDLPLEVLQIGIF